MTAPHRPRRRWHALPWAVAILGALMLLKGILAELEDRRMQSQGRDMNVKIVTLTERSPIWPWQRSTMWVHYQFTPEKVLRMQITRATYETLRAGGDLTIKIDPDASHLHWHAGATDRQIAWRLLFGGGLAIAFSLVAAIRLRRDGRFG